MTAELKDKHDLGANALREKLINELSDLSLSLSDSLEYVGESELESNNTRPLDEPEKAKRKPTISDTPIG